MSHARVKNVGERSKHGEHGHATRTHTRNAHTHTRRAHTHATRTHTRNAHTHVYAQFITKHIRVIRGRVLQAKVKKNAAQNSRAEESKQRKSEVQSKVRDVCFFALQIRADGRGG